MNHAPNGCDDVGHRPILGVDVNCEQGRLQRAGAALDAAQRPPGRPWRGEPAHESPADGLGTGDEREVMHGGTRPAQAANRFVEVGRIHDRHRYHERPRGDRGGCSRSLRPSGVARMGCPGSPRCGLQPERPCAASCRCLRDPLSERRSALQQGRVRRSSFQPQRRRSARSRIRSASCGVSRTSCLDDFLLGILRAGVAGRQDTSALAAGVDC